MKVPAFLLVFLGLGAGSCAQLGVHTQGVQKKELQVGGPCEGCEAVFENKVPFNQLNEIDTLPHFSEKGRKILLRGTVYQNDAVTPAPGIVLYIYQTDETGRYRTRGEQGWGARHGSLRGWIRTNGRGEYSFYTLRPASYPGSTEPAHIHVTVKEPGKTAYYIDDFLFDDDPFLTTEQRARQQNRGGKGIVSFRQDGNLLLASRNIILGQAVQDYPQNH